MKTKNIPSTIVKKKYNFNSVMNQSKNLVRDNNHFGYIKIIIFKTHGYILAIAIHQKRDINQ